MTDPATRPADPGGLARRHPRLHLGARLLFATLAGAATIGLPVLYVAHLRPVDLGMLALLSLLAGFLGAVASLGVHDSLGRRERASHATRPVIVGTARVNTLIASASILMLLLALAEPIGDWLGTHPPARSPGHAGMGPSNGREAFGDLELLLRLTGGIIFLHGIRAVAIARLRATGSHARLRLLSGSEAILRLALTWCFFGGLNIEISGALLGWFLALAPGTLLAHFWLMHTHALETNWEEAMGQLRDGVSGMADSLSRRSLDLVDRAVLWMSEASSRVGLYHLAHLCGHLVETVAVGPLRRASEAALERLPAERRAEARATVAPLGMALVASIALGVGLLLDDIVEAIGRHEHPGAADLAFIIALGYGSLAVSRLVDPAADRRGVARGRLGATALAAVLHLVLSLVLVARMGAAGAAWALLVALTLLAIARLYLERERLLLDPWRLAHLAAFLVGAVVLREAVGEIFPPSTVGIGELVAAKAILWLHLAALMVALARPVQACRVLAGRLPGSG